MDIECNFLYKDSKFDISEERARNYLKLNNIEYYVSYLNANYKSNKGGNSFVYALYTAQIDNEDAIPEKVIKISKYYEKYINNRIKKSYKNNRFRQEIEALYDCKAKKVNNIIDIDCDGNLICKTYGCKDKIVSFPFYVMEYAESDLKSFFENNEETYDIATRIELCLQIAQGIKELHELGYYHRDIKPDNIFMVDHTWKIGDLGLIQMRNKPTYDKLGELVGPKGWLSPEAMNKYLSESVNEQKFDCNIDHQSDIFQLAKVFGYILQGNAPIGCVEESDFLLHNTSLYSLLREMLNHAKQRRPHSIDEVIQKLQSIIDEYTKV